LRPFKKGGPKLGETALGTFGPWGLENFGAKNPLVPKKKAFFPKTSLWGPLKKGGANWGKNLLPKGERGLQGVFLGEAFFHRGRGAGDNNSAPKEVFLGPPQKKVPQTPGGERAAPNVQQRGGPPNKNSTPKKGAPARPVVTREKNSPPPPPDAPRQRKCW